MCGIAGILNRGETAPPPIESLEGMAGVLRHRGPDEFGVYRDDRAGLAHARLAIIDLATGQQPLSNEDGTIWLVFNGEIYNYPDLRKDLLARGHLFRTKSDTEVIVHAFEAWGLEALPRLNGQFAIALWDSTAETLILARDRYGVRPLHLCEHGGRLFFASEVGAIFAADPSIPRRFDPAGLDETFTFWSVLPPRTIFSGVSQVVPGCALVVTRNGIREHRFWSPHYTGDTKDGFTGSVEEAAAAVREALEQAVRLRVLRSDVPVGCYLSGGLDSSLVAALGRGVKGEKLLTFSLRFQDAEYDETFFQQTMVARLGSDHREVVVSRRDIAAIFPDVVAHTEQPILRTAPAPLYILSRLVNEAGIKVVLTGEGADEMFAGYDIFREGKIRRFWARRPESIQRPRLLERLYPYLARSPVASAAMARSFFGQGLEDWRSPAFLHGPRWRTTSALKRLLSPEVRETIRNRDVVAQLLASLPAEFRDWSLLAQDQYLEIRTLLSTYLLSSQGDRMLMAHSVEGRFPYLDPAVVGLADSLPACYKLRVLDEKHVLKKAAERLVPDSVLRRKKQPYRAPDAISFVASDAPDWVEEMSGARAILRAGVFDPSAVARLLRKCRRQAGDGIFSNTDNMAVTGILSTQLLHHLLIQNVPDGSKPIPLKTFVDLVETRDRDARCHPPSR